ncbi:hypothetical protein COCC4DRAFT_181912 [Bipolaris maydis ATCC 48331]|uniref:BTB domain-containing protein n=1 Tax=Cochliobolus heterostrophus (strain C4 / ATCC 48331 / race T) TaxID=665024 RepID=N4X1K6_COCH4|nr:uncharacterized protein COCC4DRAFT_181912 [Bipolaris maydis ATCC 48331]KAH7558666.1 hypothetical protein BM1_04803 [Bipolaris maydis]ENH99091.1 hypothetical protein COCC4DRAFT_181912 [Bipolaris maydis ATCC 48331]KAJ5028919.1 hypothetical protein J3E73DRAFT_208095 [Bipolaris maydis]KAJ5063704.1 hypothetical protein J3E74DRAFT_238622 [Bipolaris maydis]KAJ6208583.1 hypothetical protein PSV09DRAFT_2244202 [Bipolaris maydis]
MATTLQKQLLDSLKSSLASGTYSDFKITCGSDTYKVRKVIVCNRAGFFARAVGFGGQETESGILDLPEDEPETVKLLIQYLYERGYEPQLPLTDASFSMVAISTPVEHGKSSSKKLDYHLVFPHTCYNEHDYCHNSRLCPHHYCGQNCDYTCRGFACPICDTPALTGSSSQLLIYSKIYQMANKYEVVGLKELTKEKFNKSCSHFWNTSDFHIAANYTFSTTPEGDGGLRDLINQSIAKHMELAQGAAIRKLLTQFNGLALGILNAKSEELGWNTKS